MTEPGLIPVRDNHRFDIVALEDFLERNVAGYEQGANIRQFASGQSNPTFLLDSGACQYVLRKKPPGKLLPSAHQIEREYRIYQALADTDVPVPEVLTLCQDPSIIGTSFYVMRHVPGRVFADPILPDSTADQRREIYLKMIQVLAALHQVDYVSKGLSDYGKPGNYFVRQTGRWTKQYLAAQTDEIPAMDQLIEWLPRHVPSTETTTIVHGDYQLYNLIYHPSQPACEAVLDWELSTLGNPLADLAYNCMGFHQPNTGLSDQTGIPTEEDLVSEYCRVTGRHELELEHWNFCLAFSFFRLASIVQGVYRRGLQGNASSARALEFKNMVSQSADTGWQVANRPQTA